MFKRLLGISLVFSLVAVPITALSQDTANGSIASLQAQIQALLAQIESLQAQVSGLQSENKEIRTELKSFVDEFRSQLHIGLKNEEVKLLQEILSTDSDIYPEGIVTGYFGPLTRRAIIRFQEKNGIEGVGEVGPQTRRALNAFLKKDRKGKMISSNLLKKFDTKDTIGDDDVESEDSDNSTTTRDRMGFGFGRHKVIICHLPGGNLLKGKTHRIGSPALNAHLAHGDTIGACGGDNDDDNDNNDNGTTTVDSIAPVISNITHTVASSTVDISWNTDEAATSRVVYGTSTPVVSDANAVYVSSLTLVNSHMVNLSGLSASTTHYYVVSSSDSVGNRATSTESMFISQ